MTPDREDTARQIHLRGGRSFYYQCDITNQEQVDRAIESIEAEVGIVTMLFHCCSLPSPRAVISEAPSVQQTMDVSVTSYFYVSCAIK